MNFIQIYQDESLYGHRLLSLPQKIWDFSKKEFCFYDTPDPDTLSVVKNYGFARGISYRKGNTFHVRTEFIFEKPFCNGVEFIARRILGPCTLAVSCLTVVPLGFTVKVLHLDVRKMIHLIKNTPLAEKINKIWNDQSLVGHALTSLPSKCYKFAKAPFSWHLGSDGTDRRVYRAQYGKETIIHESEYMLVPFEFIGRRLMGGTTTLVSGILSPLGLVVKAIHLACRP